MVASDATSGVRRARADGVSRLFLTVVAAAVVVGTVDAAVGVVVVIVLLLQHLMLRLSL